MTQPVRLQETTLPDGTKAYLLSDEQMKALSTMLDNQIWWGGAWKRARRVGPWAGAIVLALMTLSQWLPWITRIVQFLTHDMPIR